MKFGVVRFPGSCDEVDALMACRRFAEADLLWHGDRDLSGIDAVVLPGGFSYGDYLQASCPERCCRTTRCDSCAARWTWQSRTSTPRSRAHARRATFSRFP